MDGSINSNFAMNEFGQGQTRHNHVTSPQASSTTRKRIRAIQSSGSDQAVGTSIPEEKCAICLSEFSNQEVGSPNGCLHTFCLTCLVQWSKRVNKCPLDRRRFSVITVREKRHRKVIRRIPVEEPSPLHSYLDYIYCWVCGSADREEQLLLCDSCDRGFHMQCLTPPLTEVPENEWFCPHCSVNIEEMANEDFYYHRGRRGTRTNESGHDRHTSRRNLRTRQRRRRQSSRIRRAMHLAIMWAFKC